MNIKSDLCVSRHHLPGITLYVTQQDWKCLDTRNGQYTEFHISFLGVVGHLGEKLQIFIPLGFDIQKDLIMKLQ